MKILSLIFLVWCLPAFPDDGGKNSRSKPIKVPEKNIVDPNSHLIYFEDYLKSTITSWHDELGIDVHLVVDENPNKDLLFSTRKIYQDRGIGKNSVTGGVLVYINTYEKSARIVVSHSLEPLFTDALVGSVAKNQLAPYASYNMLGMAVMDSLQFLRDHLLMSVASGSFQLHDKYKKIGGNKSILGFLSGGGGGQTKIPTIDFNNNWKQPVSPDHSKYYLPAKSPLESAEAYSRALRDMIGYPHLSLFTESSHVMRESYPFAPYESYLRHIRIEKSRPLVVESNGTHAVVFSNRPAEGLLPIFLVKEGEVWKVDMAEMLKNQFFDKNGNFWMKNSGHPYIFAFIGVTSNDYEIRPLVYDASLKETIADLKRVDTAPANYLLGEYYFRNAFAAMESLEYYERAVEMDPTHFPYRKTLSNRYMYLGMKSLAMKHFQEYPANELPDAIKALAKAQYVDDARILLNKYEKAYPHRAQYVASLREWIKGKDKRAK